MTCPACVAAETNPYAGEYRVDCLGCEVRAVSNAPHDSRLAFYAQIGDPAQREAFAAAVVMEFKRRQGLRMGHVGERRGG